MHRSAPAQVESGEGIERLNLIALAVLSQTMWNPVKELKDGDTGGGAGLANVESGEGIESKLRCRLTRTRLGWNPVKELKDNLLAGRRVISCALWNPVKELKDHVDFPDPLGPVNFL